MKRSNFPIISLLLFVITAFVTVFLFYYLTEEKSRTSIFVFNLLYVCFLEFLFFGYIALLKFSKIHSGAIYSVAGTVGIFYIISAVLLVLIYNIFLSRFVHVKFYISSIIILTTLTIITYGFLVKLDIHHKESTESERTKIVSLQTLLTSFEILQGRFERILKAKGLIEKNQSGFTNSIEKLTAKIKFIPLSAAENHNFLTLIKNYEQDLKSLINQLEMAETGTENDFKHKIEDIVSDAILTIETSKKTFLK